MMFMMFMMFIRYMMFMVEMTNLLITLVFFYFICGRLHLGVVLRIGHHRDEKDMGIPKKHQAVPSGNLLHSY